MVYKTKTKTKNANIYNKSKWWRFARIKRLEWFRQRYPLGGSKSSMGHLAVQEHLFSGCSLTSVARPVSTMPEWENDLLLKIEEWIILHTKPKNEMK